MCCNNTFCNAEADIENFDAMNHPRQGEQPTPNNATSVRERNAINKANVAGGPMSMNSGSLSYERGATHLASNNDYSNFQAATSNHGHYDEPSVDVLANSRRLQLADALGQSASKN